MIYLNMVAKHLLNHQKDIILTKLSFSHNKTVIISPHLITNLQKKLHL